MSLTRLREPLIGTALIVLLAYSASASDWPAYRQDARRSAVSTDRLDFPMSLVWHRKSSHPPRPAFADPLSHPTGVDFAYIRDHSEPVLLDFDHAFHPVSAGGRVFFGSSADDAVRCLSLATGKQEWVFVTGGPVRFAPQVMGDRLFVASDDGFVYCLSVTSGEVIWQFQAAPSPRQLVGNGRMISSWPLRTGVLVLDGTVYVTAGMWPAEGIFIYAIDANTGTVKWVNDTSGTINEPTKNAGAYTIAGVAPTGYLLAGHDALVVPTGRSIPASYSLEDGRLLKAVAPSYQNRRGGPAVCIDPHGSLIFGYPRERLTGTTYSVHYAYRLPTMQPFGSIRADRLVVDDRAFVAVNDLIRCYTYDARYRKVTVPWQADCPSKTIRCMSLAANALLMGIDDSLVARDRATGDVLWKKDDLDGYVQSVAVVDGQLLVATDSGSLYCFATGGRLSNSETTPVLTPQPTVPRLADGWRNALKHGRIHRGLALVIGQTDTALAAQIATATQLQVVLLLDDTDAVMEARRSLLQSWNPDRGQVSVQREIRDKPLPFADYAFNLIAATGAVAAHRAAELRRVLRPSGGILYIDEASVGIATQVEVALQRASESDRSVSTPRANEEAPSEETADARPQVHPAGKTEYETRRVGNTLICRRGKLPGALDWDSETKTDQRVKWPLELLWFGGPGSKRTGSGSRAPVAAGGRNLVIGKNHLIALDAYNGTELWSRTIPYLYRNIGRLKNAPGPIKPWLTQSISSDDERTYLNFGHVVYTLDAATGEQQAVHGELPVAPEFSLKERPQFVLDHYQKPDIRGTVGTATKSPTAAGTIQLLALRDEALTVTLRLDAATEVTDKLYWELFFDVRPPAKRDNLYERGLFQLLVKPATGRVEVGLGPAHPKLSVVNKEKGRHVVITIPYAELSKLGGVELGSVELGSVELGSVELGEFCFAAALNHQPSADQKSLAGGRGYLRWEFHADAFAYAFNNGWPRIIVADKSNRQPIQLPAISELPNHAVRSGRIGRVGRRAGYVVNVGRERQNPLSLEVDGFEYNRGKGCGNPVACGSLHVLRSGTLAFYDLNDDSGMRYFGGVRPSCTVSAVPAQGVVFAAEGSSGCSCNYNFKTTLALSPARHRRHEDWAMFMAPLSPGALLRTGRFNLGAPGDRRDDGGGLWLQYPRAPTYPNRSMPVPVELIGQSLKPFRVNADRVPIANTDRPWLYASGFEGIEGIRLRLFMSDKEGIVVFPDKSPVLDAVIEETAWEKRFAVPAGIGSTMYLSHDHKALYVGYEVVPPIDRRGVRQPWQAKGSLPHAARFALSEEAEDTAVWQEDSLEFLISDTSLKTILHFGVGVTTGRYDGLWSSARKTEEAAYAARWAGAIEVTEERAVAEIALPWKTLTDAGLDLENLVIRPRMKQPLVRQPHISHGFRPILVQANQPQAKRYQVALHFAELGDVAVGERVFDIQIQGKTVLEGFDPVAVAGGSRRAVVQVFRGILADRALDIHFLSHPDSSTNAHSPMLSALEVLLDK